MPLHIERHALTKPLLAKKGLQHTNHFSPLFINRCRVEVANLLVLQGPNGMGHGARIFRKLMGAQRADIFNALNGPGTSRLLGA